MPFLFPTTVTSLNDVPPQYQVLYELDSGGVSATLVDDLRRKIEPSDGLEKALKAERRRADDNERALSNWKQLSGVSTPEAIQARIDEINEEHKRKIQEVETLASGKLDNAEVAKQINSIRTDIEKEHRKQIDKLTGDLTTANTDRQRLQGKIESFLRENAATSAIAEHKGSPHLLKLLVASSLKVDVDDDGDYVLRVIDTDGDVRMDTDGKPMTPSAFVAKLKQDDRYAGAFEGDGASGSGSRGSPRLPGGAKQKNPFKKGSPDWNLTEQMRISKADPALAERLKVMAASG